MPTPELWIIAGPNGAGKTTTVQKGGLAQKLSGAQFINPDAITLEYLKEQGFQTWNDAPSDVLMKTFIRAAEDSAQHLADLIEEGGSVAVETVLSTRKYCEVVERVLALGGDFRLIYLALNSPVLSAERVAQRALAGGHDVPAEKLGPRWHASLELLPWFAFSATEFYMLDNSQSDKAKPGILLISGHQNEVCLHGLPSLEMRPIISDFITRLAAMDTEGKWRFEIEDSYLPPPEFAA